MSLNLEVDARAIKYQKWPAHDNLVQLPVMGCDLGIKSLVCVAAPDGSFVQHSMALQAVDGARTAIRGHQRRLAIKRVASKRRAKATKQSFRKVKKARGGPKRGCDVTSYANAKFRRRTFIHHLTTDLAGRCDVIGVENLHIAGMLNNHRLAWAIAQQA